MADDFPYTVRKVYFPGHAAAVSLPLKWVRKHNVFNKPYLVVTENDDDSLTIRPLSDPRTTDPARHGHSVGNHDRGRNPK